MRARMTAPQPLTAPPPPSQVAKRGKVGENNVKRRECRQKACAGGGTSFGTGRKRKKKPPRLEEEEKEGPFSICPVGCFLLAMLCLLSGQANLVNL